MRFLVRLRHYFGFLFIPRGRTPACYFAGALAECRGGRTPACYFAGALVECEGAKCAFCSAR